MEVGVGVAQSRLLEAPLGASCTRRFLIQEIDKLPREIRIQLASSLTEIIDISQGYYLDELFNVRLRREYNLSNREVVYRRIRNDGHGASKEIGNILSEGEFRTQWGYFVRASLSFMRFILFWQGSTIYFDRFTGELSGYVRIETEFKSSDESQYFEVPEWFGDEVTFQKEHNDRNLAEHGIPA